MSTTVLFESHILVRNSPKNIRNMTSDRKMHVDAAMLERDVGLP